MGSLTSKDAALSRRECLSRLSTARPDVCSTCPREPSVLSSTREFVARSCPRGSTSGFHAKHSQCRKDFLDRVHANEVRKKEAKASGQKGAPCKRFPAEPKS